MPRDGSGVYSKPNGTTAVTGTTISSSDYNLLMDDLASEMTNSLPRNGAAAMTGNLDLGGNDLITSTGDFSIAIGGASVFSWVNSTNTLDIGTRANTQMSITANNCVLGITTAAYTFKRPSTDRVLHITGGDDLNNGAELVLYGPAHASFGNDFIIRTNGNDRIMWDNSALHMTLDAGSGGISLNAPDVDVGNPYSNTGAANGVTRTSNEVRSSRSGTGDLIHYRFYNPNGSVGSIRTNGTTTSYLTTSDARLKADFRDFDGLNLVNAMKVYDFAWSVDNARMFGPKAQELVDIVPQAVARGNDKAPGDPDFEEWAYDPSKLVPVLIRAVQQLSAEVAILKARGAPGS